MASRKPKLIHHAAEPRIPAFRALTESEVTFTIETEEEDISPFDSFDDPDMAQEVADRYDSGHTEAWCCVVVTASWEGFTGRDYLGGCSLSDDYTAETASDEHGMKAQALAALNQAIAEQLGKLKPVFSKPPSKALPRPGRAVRPSDLDRLKSTQETHVLECPRCGGRYSAHYADYSFYAHDKPFRCCGVNNHLIAL